MSSTLQELCAERFGLDPAAMPDATTELSSAQVEQLKGMVGRSICRRYRTQAIPEALLDTLLAAAQSAPSKSDLQQYSIVVVDDAAQQEIASWLPTMPWIAEAEVFLVFCADVNRNRTICALHGRPHANDSMDMFLNCAVDAALALGAFITAAESVGLGVCPISYVRNHLPKITPLLGLPPGVFPIAGLCVGWPEESMPRSMRLPPSIVVHRGRYDTSRFGEDLENYDARRDARNPIAPDKQRNVATYGVQEICRWSDNVARQLSLPERAEFREFLRGHGFSLH